MAAIIGLASYLPRTIRTIDDIITIVNEQHGGVQHQYAPDGTIRKTVTPTRDAIMKYMGVEERRIAIDEDNATLGARAAEQALRAAGRDASGTICATVGTGTYPSNAARLHHALGAQRKSYVADLTSSTPLDDALRAALALARQRPGNYLVLTPHVDILLTPSGTRQVRALTPHTTPDYAHDNEARVLALDTLLARAQQLAAPHELDGIIVAREGRSVAERIEEQLGLNTGCAFDLHAACAGFGFGLDLANGLATPGDDPYLVVSSERLSVELDYSDANSPLFGDGAGAALVGIGEGLAVRAVDYGVLSEHAELIFRDDNGRLRMPDGHTVFKHAVREMSTAVQRVADQAGWSLDEVDLLVAHQANIRILNQVGSRTGIPPENVVITIHRYGNMSGPTCPVALHEALLDGRIHEGSKLVQVSFGSGLVYSATALEATAQLRP